MVEYDNQKVVVIWVFWYHFGVWVQLEPLHNVYKLAPNDDDGLINMTTLATAAKANNWSVNVGIENDVVRWMLA